MAENTLLTLDIPTGAAVTAVGNTAYDALGMPRTLRAAKSMTSTAIIAALEHALMALRRSAEPISAYAPIDSLDVVYLLGKFYNPLNRKTLNLAKVDRDRWASLAGVADVLREAMRSQA